MPERALELFDPMLPTEESRTPPYDWYVKPEFAERERRTVFERSWIHVGRADQVEQAGDFFTAEIAGNPVVVVRDEDHSLYGLHNVCRHSSAIVATEPEGHMTPGSCLTCPYHGWQYRFDGQIAKMPAMSKIPGGKQELNLPHVAVNTWKNFVFADLDGPLGGHNNPRSLDGDFAHIEEWLQNDLSLDNMVFFERREYVMNCNWKIFVDNSLDGGYHVKYAHEGLASGLDEDTFETHIYDRSVVQVCNTNTNDERLGGRVAYAWLFPNFFINRYGNMMDTNLVLPLGADRCKVIFDFYFDFENFEDFRTKKRMQREVDASHAIQLEDVEVCESAQRGRSSMSFQRGFYSSKLEAGVHAFHKMLWREMRGFND